MKTITTIQMRTNLLAAALLAAALMIPSTQPAWAGSDKSAHPGVLPPSSKPFGKSYGEWAATFWQWALALPLEGHIFLDQPNDPYFDLGANQSGKVWFWGAPDGPFTRKFNMPAGTALFVTIRDVEVSTLEEWPFYGATEADQRALATWFADRIVNLYCIIDGVPVQNIYSYRAATPQFEFTAPTPWIFGQQGGTGTAVGDGYYVMLAPMSQGLHVIEYGGTYHFEPGELIDEALDLPHVGRIEVTVE